MDENGIVIWKSRAHTLSFIVLLGLFIGVVLFGIFFQKNELRDVLLGVFVLAVLIGLFVFLIKHWRRQSVEIAISLKGVYFEGKGLYPWSLIESFSTTEHHDDVVTMKLTLHFSQYEDEDFDITHVNVGLEELVEYMLYYKGTFATGYRGHTKK